MSEAAAVHKAEESLRTILKAVVVGAKGQDPASRPGGEDLSSAFAAAGALEPPYDPEALCLLLEHSNSLRQNVDAYATNIDGFGHRFEPAIDFDADDADERVADTIYLERLAARDRGELAEGTALQPTDEEVAERKRELQQLARIERGRLESFFDFCCFDHSFVDLRRRTRQDLEVTGNAFWEVLRDGRGEIARLVYVPSYSVRLLPLDREPVEIEDRVRVSPVTFETVSARRRLRRYVQVQGTERVYFKSFRDPRVVSRRTGRVYPDAAALLEDDPADGPATEIVHFAIHSPRSPYGVPRWVGTLLSVLGSRQMEEVNYLYFENKSVPPLALLVSGGRLSEASVPRIERFIEENLKGKANFHKVLILEAEGGTGGGDTTRAKIELRPLTDAQQQDALFQVYDERNIDKVGSAFRLPKLLRGESKDFNRACYSADTETLTENGWKRYFDIADNERIATFNPETRSIEFHPARARYAYRFTGEMVHFKSTAVDILVTPEHMMWLRASACAGGEFEPWRRVAACDIPWMRYQFTVACDHWQGHEEREFLLPHVPQQSHRHGPHPPIPFDLWLEFLGYYLSDGGVLQSDNAPSNYSVFIRQKKPWYVERFQACAERLREYGFRFRHTVTEDDTHVFRASDKCLWTWLRANVGGYSRERHIPREYLGLSVRQLLVLYNAMMAGDGGGEPAGSRTARCYYTASRALADQMQEMLIRLGMRASVGKAPRTWRVNHVPNGRVVGIHDGKNVRRVPYDGMVYCFEVPGHLFVTRRNGKVAIQGNTAESALRFAEDQVFQPERDEFDFLMNRQLLADLGIRFWRFRSQTPVTRDPERMTQMVEKLVRVGVLTPEEGRFLAGDIFNREFRKIGDDWTKRPITLTLAGVQTQRYALENVAKAPADHRLALLNDARFLLSLQEELQKEEERLASRRMALARRYLGASDRPGSPASEDEVEP